MAISQAQYDAWLNFGVQIQNAYDKMVRLGLAVRKMSDAINPSDSDNAVAAGVIWADFLPLAKARLVVLKAELDQAEAAAVAALQAL